MSVLILVTAVIASAQAVPVLVPTNISATGEPPSPLSESTIAEFAAAMRESKALMASIPDPFANWHKPLPVGPHWSDCKKIPVMQKTCLGVYAEEKDLSVGVFLSITGSSVLGKQVFDANITMPVADASHYCLKDTDLLELIELVPVLLPFKPVIDKIVKEIGKIPVHIFSVCAKLSEMSFSKTHITGHAELDNNIMCIGGHCLCDKSCTVDFGNFTIPLPGR